MKKAARCGAACGLAELAKSLAAFDLDFRREPNQNRGMREPLRVPMTSWEQVLPAMWSVAGVTVIIGLALWFALRGRR